MNDKELKELKRQFKWENDHFFISRIGIAYAKVNFDGREILSCDIKDFSLLAKEEADLYLTAFKKALSGNLGKNLLEYEFPLELEGNHPTQQKLYAFREDALQDESLFKKMVEEIISKGQYINNVCVLAAACEYVVPLKDKNDELTGETGGNYRFFLLSVHEAKLTDIGLYYDRHENSVQRKINEEMQIDSTSLDAILYPAFTDRGNDVNHVLYHCKSERHFNNDFVNTFLQCDQEISSIDQKDGFRQVLQGMFENRLKADTIVNIHNNVIDSIRENAEETGVLSFSKGEVKELLEASGADEKSMENFNSVYTLVMEDRPLNAVNMTDPGRISFKTNEINLSVKNAGVEKVSLKMIDGKKYLMISIDDDVEIDGLKVSL